MKKSGNSSYNTAMQKKAENNITIVNCAVIIYALVIAILHNMSNSSLTVEGAIATKRFLMYSGMVAAMIVAAYSAYKSNKSFLKYSLMCVFVSVSSASLIFCNNHGWGNRVNFVALIMAFVFNMVYAYLTDKNLYYSNKKTRVIYRSVVGVFYGLLFIVLVFAFFNVI
ncbi:MAG: hypothetical protein ACI3XA_03390 [Clostridia bacterium]